MIALSQLKSGQSGRVVFASLPEETCRRLFVLGFAKGDEVTVLKRTFFSRTYLIAAKGGRVGLRRKTVEKIFISIEA